MSYPVNRDLWESLEATFISRGKELIKTIAKEMGRPEKPLLAELGKNPIKLHIVEQDSPAEQCMALIYTNTLAHRCRKPVYAGTDTCPNHSYTNQQTDVESENTLYKYIFRRCKCEDGSFVFHDVLTQQYYDINKIESGYVTSSGIHKIFKIETT